MEADLIKRLVFALGMMRGRAIRMKITDGSVSRKGPSVW
jgi:hypothetical protein